MKIRLVLTITFSAVLTVMCWQVAAASLNNLGPFGNVRTKSVRMPFYREGKLEFYLRSKSAALHGKLLDSQYPVIDIIRKGVNVEVVAKSDSSNSVYPLMSSVEEVNKYWKQRVYSEGVIVSDKAVLDQGTRIITSDSKVFLRSPMMDLDGVGYTVDMTRQVVNVKSNVEIILRNDGKHSLGSPLDTVSDNKSAGKAVNAVTITRVFCDELIYNIASDTMDLIGNVRVYDEAGNIVSDKLHLVFIAESGADGKKSLTDRDAASSGKKLKTAHFIGNFYAERKLDAAEAAKGKQYAKADEALYNLPADNLLLSGKNPHMGRGRDLAEARKINIKPNQRLITFIDDCKFTVYRENAPANSAPDIVTADFADWDYPKNLMRLLGNAKLKSEVDNADMQSERIFITLADDPAAAGKKQSGSKNIADGDGKSIKKIIAEGKVRFDRINQGVEERARAGRITYFANGEKVVFEQNPVLVRNKDVIRGGVLTYLIPTERMQVKNGSDIFISAETAGKSNSFAPGGPKKNAASENTPVTVVSRESDLNLGGNLLAFAGNVKVRGKGTKLDSDTLDIFLKDITAPGSKKSDAAADLSSSKQPVRALAIGNVYAEDESGILRAGLLDVYFGDKQKPGKTDVEKIIADNNMYAESKPAPGAEGGQDKNSLAARRGVIDILKDDANFYGDVKVKNNEVSLDCQHLYLLSRKTNKVIPSIDSFRQRDEFPDQIAVGEGRELVKVDAHGDVRMRRVLPSGDVQRAKSDHAYYAVKDRTVIMTCDAPRRPQAVADGTGMVGDKVTIDLDAEEIFVDNGDVLTRLDDMNF